MQYKYMKNEFTKKFFILMGVIIFVLSGCGQKSEQPKMEQQSQEEEQSSEEIPKELSELEENIEKIIKKLEGPSAKKEDEEKKGSEGEGTQESQEGSDSSQGESKESEGEQGGGGNESQGGQKGQDKQNQSQQQKSQQKRDPWKEVTDIINNMHYKWSSYMPEAAKKGANRELIDGFSNALNSLTDTAVKKDKINTLMAASRLYAHIPDFYSLYRTPTSPEIKRIKHYSRNAILNAMTGNWEQANADINNLKDSWSLFKNTIPKDNDEDSGKLDFSIYELEKVIKEKNQYLTDIKGRVALSNIESLEKALEKGKEEQGMQESKDEQSS